MSEEDIPDEKLLVKESGRIAAVQELAKDVRDLKAVAQAVGDRGLAVEETTIRELTTNNETLRRDNRFLKIAVGILVVMSIWREYRATFVTGPKVENIEATVEGPLSDANGKLDDIRDFVDFLIPLVCEGQVDENGETPDYCKVTP